MSIGNKMEVKESQQGRDEHCTGSTVAEPDIEYYQDPDRAENDATIPGSGPDMTQDLLEVGTSCSDEVFNMDPILKIE
ncbi:Hypothetical protein PENO1_110200 [Penicillium occitanis (nom. inval.)]|nr:Hypothetical protein PENO1_110200 [Penicillium occitanis (nom. inval.)]PCG88564.1 hypothetical protein PENOC_110460 [Penicillium occitanis (nom. inval.)]